MVEQTITLTPQGLVKFKNQYRILIARYAHVVHDLENSCEGDSEMCKLKTIEEKMLNDHINKLIIFFKRTEPFRRSIV